jgi:hypothetical protein
LLKLARVVDFVKQGFPANTEILQRKKTARFSNFIGKTKTFCVYTLIFRSAIDKQETIVYK